MINKKFILEAIDDGESLTINSTNDRFSGMEVIGILELKIRDLREQMQGPAKFNRTKIQEDGVYAVVKEGEEE